MVQTTRTVVRPIRGWHGRCVWLSVLCATVLAVFVGCSQDAISSDPPPTITDPADTAGADPFDPYGIDLTDTPDVADPDVSDPDVVDSVDSDAVAGDQPGPLSYEIDSLIGGDGIIVDLGMYYIPDGFRYHLEDFSEEVVVLMDSVLVRDGVVRGLVQNLSERLFARSLTVSVGGGSWVFPLTVQPTEVVPFVIEGYVGPTDSAMIEFEVTADLSLVPDPMRSFYITESPGAILESWSQLEYVFPDFALGSPPEGTTGDQLVRYYGIGAELRDATSHPSIAESVTEQQIDDLRVYLTTMDNDGKVADVRQLVPYLDVPVEDGNWITETVLVDRLPFKNPYWPDQPGRGVLGFSVGFQPGPVDTAQQFVLTFGGAHQDVQ